jgi:hypothetical protein
MQCHGAADAEIQCHGSVLKRRYRIRRDQNARRRPIRGGFLTDPRAACGGSRPAQLKF